MVGSPGALTSVVQVFSTLDTRLERLEYVQKEGADGLATLVVSFVADDRIADLLHRKLTRLIDVLSLEVIFTDRITGDQNGEIS